MVEARLKELGIELPEAPKPLAAYVPAVRTGNYVFTSGQVPLVAGAIRYTGKAGGTVSLEEAQAAARVCAVNCLSAVASVAPLTTIKRIVKVTVFVASAPGFTQQPEVANGASELLQAVFGEAGKHARSAVGVSELPRDATVEVELIAEVA